MRWNSTHPVCRMAVIGGDYGKYHSGEWASLISWLPQVRFLSCRLSGNILELDLIFGKDINYPWQKWGDGMDSCGVLIVGYDMSKDCPMLMVSRKTDDGMEIIKVLKDDNAEKVYKILTQDK